MEHPLLAREMAINSWLMALITAALFAVVRRMPTVKPGAKAMGLLATASITASALRESLMSTPGVYPLMGASLVPPLCAVVIGVIMLFRPGENRYVWLTSYVSVAASALTVIGVLIR